MNIEDILKITGAIIASLGGGALIVAAFSSWLGKVWANRILESDRAKYKTAIEILKSGLEKKIHEHNVAISRIDEQRADAIQELYFYLVEWFEAALEIRAPNKLQQEDMEVAIPAYQEWARNLREKSVKLEKLAMLKAIYLSDETYKIFAQCGTQASKMSIDFSDAVFNNKSSDPNDILDQIETARLNMEKQYQADFEPARIALIEEFRSIMDPRLKEGKS